MQLLSNMELAVGELAQVLSQSQPRVSRHVGILCDAGLAERHREGSWVFLRSGIGRERGSPVGEAVARLLATAEREDEPFADACEQDRRHLATIRAARQSNAEAFFARHAEDWDELRKLHSADQQVENALIKSLSAQPIGEMLDIGTGTGRMAELFADKAARIVALDKSLDMLRVARAKLQDLSAPETNAEIELVQGDFAMLPFAAANFDTVLLHQVLHFAHDPVITLAEAARVTKPGGRIAIIDFAAHNHEELRERFAHARLGFTDRAITAQLTEAGFDPAAPIALEDGEITVKIWLGTRIGTPASSAKRKASK